MILRGYWRSSTTYRIRIALNLKRLNYAIEPVDLSRGGQNDPAYAGVNPFETVPVLEHEGRAYSQSLAILDWLENRFPEPSFFPEEPEARALALECGYAIASDVHAPNNLRTLKWLRSHLGADEAQVKAWYHHWIAVAFDAMESKLAERAIVGGFPFGAPGFFEIMLVPQIYNAQRWEMDLSPYPTLVAIDEACAELPAFQEAHPDRQPDAPKP